MVDARSGADAASAPSQDKPVFELFTSRGFESWLKSHKSSIAFTTYQVGKIFFLGLKPDVAIEDPQFAVGLQAEEKDLPDLIGGERNAGLMGLEPGLESAAGEKLEDGAVLGRLRRAW